MTLPGIGTIAVRQDTRRLRGMLAIGRAKILSATVGHRAGRWSVSLTCEAAARTSRSATSPTTAAAGSADSGPAAFIVAACADGTEVARVDDYPGRHDR